MARNINFVVIFFLVKISTVEFIFHSVCYFPVPGDAITSA